MAGNRRRRSSKRRRRTRSGTVDVDESSNNGSGVIEKLCLSDVPSDLWEQIMSKLFFSDQINFRAVCKLLRSFDNVPPPLKQMPWLMVLEFNNMLNSYSSYYRDTDSDRDGDGEYNSKSRDSCKLFDPTYKKTYKIDMSCLNKKKNFVCEDVQIHESKYGWLLISCLLYENLTSTRTHSLFLYSPFFIDDNIIELPVLTVLNDAEYIATFDFISNSSKKTEEEEEGFEVLVLSSDTNGTICIKTCRQGDNSWSCNKTIWNFQLRKINCFVYSEGIFYYATSTKLEKQSESGSYDIVRNNWTKFPTLVSVQPLGELHLIKFGGDIYLISVQKYIYKLNISKGMSWKSIELHDLDDRVVFVGDEYSSILELDNEVKELKDQKQKVYSCCNEPGGGYAAYATVLEHCNARNKNIRSCVCSESYGSHALNQDCIRLWIDPPRRIRNSI